MADDDTDDDAEDCLPADIYVGGEQIVSADDWPASKTPRRTRTEDRAAPTAAVYERRG